MSLFNSDFILTIISNFRILGTISPYDNIDKISINENYNTPQIIKISKLKKITAKKSFQESSINDDKIISKKGLNVKTFPSEIPSFDKKQGENE